MNAGRQLGLRQGLWFGRRARQGGGETVEFALLAFFFFLLLFAIIDISLVMFNNAVVNQAARYAARQGTLFWMDVDNFDVADPPGNICVKDEMITSAIDFYGDSILIKTAEGFDTQYFDVVGAPRNNNDDGWCEVSHNNVVVQLGYPHDYLILDGLLNLADINLGSDTGLITESNM